jgi:hypothetical protein
MWQRWQSSFSWFNQIWLLIKYEGKKFQLPYIFLARLLELCIEMWQFLKIFSFSSNFCNFFSKHHRICDKTFPNFLIIAKEKICTKNGWCRMLKHNQ